MSAPDDTGGILRLLLALFGKGKRGQTAAGIVALALWAVSYMHTLEIRTELRELRARVDSLYTLRVARREQGMPSPGAPVHTPGVQTELTAELEHGGK